MRHVAAAVLITIAVTVLTLAASTTVRAQTTAFNGPQAVGVMVGAGLLGGMVCWTVELANAESRFDDAPRVERPDDYERTGWFVGFKGVSATEFLDEDEEADSLRGFYDSTDIEVKMDSQSTSGGFSLVAGRRCNDRFSIEFDFESVDDFSGKVNRTDTGANLAKLTFAPIVATVNLKGYLLTGRYQPYGLIGIGLMSIDEVTTAPDGAKSQQTTGVLALRFGAGIDYYLTRNWLLTMELDYVYSATDIATLDYLSLGFGVGYRF